MAGSAAAEASAPGPQPIVAARCHPAGGGAAVASPAELEFGDTVSFADGHAVAMIHRTAAGRVAAVALVDRDVTSARVVDLGATLGDAPPPHVVRRGNDLLVASYALPKQSGAREVTVQLVGVGGEARPLATVPQQRDDSLAFDLGPGLMVWDEATAGGGTPRGVVRGAEIAADHAGPARDLSPPDSDAEMPRVVASGAGSFVLWMARHPEPGNALDAAASAAIEATGEARAYSWLEVVNVDAAGVPTGAARRLTPASGRVSSYDVLALSGEGKTTLLVVARDDGEAMDGSGGALLRMRVREDGADPPAAFQGDGLGRGAPSLVDAPMPWLAWIGPHEELRLIPLDAAGAPLAPPSAEPLLDDALPLAMVPSPDTEGRMLVAFPGESPAPAAPAEQTAPLRVFACSR